MIQVSILCWIRKTSRFCGEFFYFNTTFVDAAMIIDFTQLPSASIYHTMTQTVVPRPIAWVLTSHDNGQWNVAPFSYFNAVSSHPPLVSLSVGRKRDGSKKDTWSNIEKHSDFVVHIPQVRHVDAVLKTAESLAAGLSELDAVPLDTESFEGCPLPRLRGLPIAFHCTKHDIHLIGDEGQALILGRIQQLYLHDSIIEQSSDPSKVNLQIETLDPLARLGSDAFARVCPLPS